MERLNTPNKVAGIKQTKAAIKSRKALVVFVGSDAAPSAVGEVIDLCKEMDVELVCDHTRKELAKACRIDVPCAAATVLK